MNNNTRMFLIIIFILNITYINNSTSNLKQEEKKEEESDLLKLYTSKITVSSVLEIYNKFTILYNSDDDYIYELIKDNQAGLIKIIEENVKEVNIDKKSLIKKIKEIFSMSNEMDFKESLLKIIKEYNLENFILNTHK